MASIFEQMLPCSWRGIEIPVSALRLSLSHDLAEHKYVGVDGANLEATGRNSMQIEIVIPFFNGIVPGKNEKWTANNLYPVRFRDFLHAFVDRTTGVLQHPELGEITCKPETLDFNLEPTHRDGVEVTARFRETVILGDDGQVAVGNSPIQFLYGGAFDLDASDADLLSLVPERPEEEETFASLVNKLTGFVDKITIARNLAANKPAQILYRLNQLAASVDRARTPLTWPTTNAITQMSVALHDVAVAMTKGTRKVLRYTVQAPSTLATLTSVLPGSNVDDLIHLNPQLLGRPDVQPGAVVRYYAP